MISRSHVHSIGSYGKQSSAPVPRSSQGQKSEVIDHAKRKLVTHDILVEKHSSLFYVDNSFEPGALQVNAILPIPGWPTRAPLWICVEWDSGTVMVGYRRESGSGRLRAQLGREEWFLAFHLVNGRLGEESMRFGTRVPASKGVSLAEEIWLENHNAILEVTRFCQTVLNGVDKVTEREKRIVRLALRT